METDFDTASLFATTVHARLASGKLLAVFARKRVIDTQDMLAIYATVASIVSECLYAGMACTEPQALAAAFSVPDGTPLEMALLNVGPAPSDEVVAIIATHRAAERATKNALAKAR